LENEVSIAQVGPSMELYDGNIYIYGNIVFYWDLMGYLMGYNGNM